jgi:hypothetical protein
MPPMVAKAFYSGANIVIDFNEAIQLVDGETALTIFKSDKTNGKKAVYATDEEWTLSNSNKTLTIKPDEFDTAVGTGLAVNDSTDWNLANFTYADDANLYNTGSSIKHAVLNFNNVKDARNNSWATYATNTAGRNIAEPQFAMANTVTALALDGSANNTLFKIADDTTTQAQTVSGTFNHALSTTISLFDNATLQGDGTFKTTTAADIQAYFEVLSGGTPQELTNFGSTLSATLSADKKTLTIVFTTTNDVTATTEFIRTKVNKDLISDYDITKKFAGNALTINAI